MKTIHVAFLTVSAVALASAAGCSRSADTSGESSAALGGIPIGEIQGAVAVSETIRARLLDNTDTRTTQFGIERVAGTTVFELRNQLGAFTAAGTSTSYQNGTPAPFGVALWHQLFARFGAAMGNVCTTGAPVPEVDAGAAPADAGTPRPVGSASSSSSSGGFGGAEPAPSPRDVTFGPYAVNFGEMPRQTFRLHPAVFPKVMAVCTYQGTAEERAAAAGNYFDAVMGIGGSLAEERIAFVKTFAADGSSFVSAAPKDRVSAMTQALMMNPHFLLKK